MKNPGQDVGKEKKIKKIMFLINQHIENSINLAKRTYSLEQPRRLRLSLAEPTSAEIIINIKNLKLPDIDD